MIEELTNTKKATEPPKRWRNLWRASADHWNRDTSSGLRVFRIAGEEWLGDSAWPSKDIAISRARRDEETNRAKPNGARAHYIGTFPADE